MSVKMIKVVLESGGVIVRMQFGDKFREIGCHLADIKILEVEDRQPPGLRLALPDTKSRPVQRGSELFVQLLDFVLSRFQLLLKLVKLNCEIFYRFMQGDVTRNQQSYFAVVFLRITIGKLE